MTKGIGWKLLLMAPFIPGCTSQVPSISLLPAAHQHLALDARMYGLWTLDAPHSVFGGPYPPPISGKVNWTVSGWAFALAFADGGIYTDAAYTDYGCSLVGVPAPWRCSVEVVSPTHIHLVMREGSRVDRSADIELVDENTQRALHRVTPSTGQPFTETTVWKRDKS